MSKLFYVYELFTPDGVVEYVGKGSGSRLTSQKRNHGLDGRKVREFDIEGDAFAFEVKHIAAVKPSRNKCAGGNGGRVGCRYMADVSRLGTQVYAARLWLRFAHAFKPSPSEIEQVRRVAYG
jgi:hypothetical protein